MKTGYFARPFNYYHKSKTTMVHIVDNDNKPICGYKPHRTMKFQWCSLSVYLIYVECKKCKKEFRLLQRDSFIKKVMTSHWIT